LLEIVAIPFAIGYAVVTYYQWSDAHHNFILDQRAWLRMTLPELEAKCAQCTEHDIPVPIPKNLQFNLSVTNVGKTPAFDIRILATAEIQPIDKAPSL